MEGVLIFEESYIELKNKASEPKLLTGSVCTFINRIYGAFHVKWNHFLVKSDITDMDFDENWLTC